MLKFLPADKDTWSTTKGSDELGHVRIVDSRYTFVPAANALLDLPDLLSIGSFIAGLQCVLIESAVR
jgi:hypothetical protein